MLCLGKIKKRKRLLNMRNFFSIILAVIFVGLSTRAAGPLSSRHPHLDPEMTSEEYRQMLAQRAHTFDMTEIADPETPSLDAWIALGDRMNKWVELINSHRDLATQISLSSPGTQTGSSPLQPGIYNFAIIQDQWRTIQILLPTPLSSVIFGKDQLPEKNPMSDRDFIDWMSQVNRAYQSSARYKMMKPYISQLKLEAAYDVRGYLRLSGDAELDQKLASWDQLTDLQREQISRDMILICVNTLDSKANCRNEFQSALSAKTLQMYKVKYLPLAKKNYEGYFQIQATRRDVSWDPVNPTVLSLPFTNPHNQAVYDYLKLNIEDEWKWNDWQLKLNFIESNDLETTHVEFEPGVTPHVNGLAGSTITMDQNELLTEYNVKWTIRHEFGHVMGFGDCYLEFYDEALQAIVNYQLDVTNLMCSRRGHFQQIHFDELKKNYYK